VQKVGEWQVFIIAIQRHALLWLWQLVHVELVADQCGLGYVMGNGDIHTHTRAPVPVPVPIPIPIEEGGGGGRRVNVGERRWLTMSLITTLRLVPTSAAWGM
jgi:hypothetical protein